MSGEFLDEFQKKVSAETQRVEFAQKNARAAIYAQQVLSTEIIKKHKDGTNLAGVLGDSSVDAINFIELLERNDCFEGATLRVPRLIHPTERRGLSARVFGNTPFYVADKVSGYKIGRRLPLPADRNSPIEEVYLCQDRTLKETCTSGIEKNIVYSKSSEPDAFEVVVRNLQPGEIEIGRWEYDEYIPTHYSSDDPRGGRPGRSMSFRQIALNDVLVDYASKAIPRH